MSFETSQNKEVDIIWTQTAERLVSKISLEIDSYLKINGDDGGERLQTLNNLIALIKELFLTYEKNNRTISYVENDLKYKIGNETDETQKGILEQILAMVQSKGGPLF
jgi:hypothetical protein